MDFFKYTSLNVLGMLGLSCYILADTFFVSQGLGADGLTALNLAIPIYSIVNGSGLMLGMGGATKYAVARSQGHSGKTAFVHTLLLGAALALLFVLVGIFFSRPITALLGADTTVFEMTNTYLQVILLFAPAFLLNNIFVCFVRNDGNPKLAMGGMLASSFSNIVLDYVFIFPMGMGIFGAVLATGLAPIFSMLLLSLHRKRAGFGLAKVKANPRLFGSILSLGVPSLVTELSSGIVIIVFNAIILGLVGNVGVAAYGVVANLSLVVTAIFTGIGQGMQPLLSRAHGQGQSAQIKRLLRYSMLTLAALSVAIYAVVFFCAEPIAQMFNSENNALLQEIAVQGLRLYFVAVPLVGFNIILSSFFTATERPLPAQLISLLRGLAAIIPLAYLMSSLWGMSGVWLSYPSAELVTALLAAALYLAQRRRKAAL